MSQVRVERGPNIFSLPHCHLLFLAVSRTSTSPMVKRKVAALSRTTKAKHPTAGSSSSLKTRQQALSFKSWASGRQKRFISSNENENSSEEKT